MSRVYGVGVDISGLGGMGGGLRVGVGVGQRRIQGRFSPGCG